MRSETRSEYAGKECHKCGKTDQEVKIEYHQSKWWYERMGPGTYFCPGCHKLQHRMEKKFMQQEAS